MDLTEKGAGRNDAGEGGTPGREAANRIAGIGDTAAQDTQKSAIAVFLHHNTGKMRTSSRRKTKW